MKYSVIWASLRITPCHKSSWCGERPGKKKVRIGMMILDVWLDENTSVEKKNIVTSHKRRGAQYSTTSFFTETGARARRCCLRNQRRERVIRVDSKATARKPASKDRGTSCRGGRAPSGPCCDPCRSWLPSLSPPLETPAEAHRYRSS